jgi:hypothetical protein
MPASGAWRQVAVGAGRQAQSNECHRCRRGRNVPGTGQKLLAGPHRLLGVTETVAPCAGEQLRALLQDALALRHAYDDSDRTDYKAEAEAL